MKLYIENLNNFIKKFLSCSLLWYSLYWVVWTPCLISEVGPVFLWQFVDIFYIFIQAVFWLMWYINLMISSLLLFLMDCCFCVLIKIFSLPKCHEDILLRYLIKMLLFLLSYLGNDVKQFFCSRGNWVTVTFFMILLWFFS